MKTPNKSITNKRPPQLIRGLASAAVVLSLAACVGDTGDLLEDTDINISTNDDGDIVITVDDNDDDVVDSDVEIVGAMYALTNQHDPSQQISASEDAASEPDRVNQVVAYARGDDGSLEQLGVYDTGGKRR